MRLELLFNPRMLCERLAVESWRRRRLDKLRNTPGQNLSTGHIESLELLEVARALGIGTIYDVGANVGTWSLLAKSIIPEASIEAFEPLPKHHASFVNNLKNIENVHLHRVSLGSENATATLHVTNVSDASSLLPLADASRKHFGVEEVGTFSTTVRRLDDYRMEHQLPPADLIKLDVQGFELEVMKGAEECLRVAKAVLTEVSFVEYYKGQCLFHEVVSYLATFNLLVTVLGPHTAKGSPLEQADILFTRRPG